MYICKSMSERGSIGDKEGNREREKEKARDKKRRGERKMCEREIQSKKGKREGGRKR